MNEATMPQPLYIVELEPGVWLSTGDGDPARTLVQDNAKCFSSDHGATSALQQAREYRRFPMGKIVYVGD